MLAPALGQLRVALPAAEQQPVRTVTYQVTAMAVLRPGLGPVRAVLLPLIGGRQEVEGRLAGGPSQDPSVRPGLDLGDHAPYKQDDLAGAASGSGRERGSQRDVESAAAAAAAKSLQSCPTLCDPTEGSPPGCSVPGILQARTLEWAAISFSNACMHAKSLQS